MTFDPKGGTIIQMFDLKPKGWRGLCGKVTVIKDSFCSNWVHSPLKESSTGGTCEARCVAVSPFS